MHSANRPPPNLASRSHVLLVGTSARELLPLAHTQCSLPVSVHSARHSPGNKHVPMQLIHYAQVHDIHQCFLCSSVLI